LLPRIFRGRFAPPSSNTTLGPVEAPLPRAIRAVVHPLLLQLVFGQRANARYVPTQVTGHHGSPLVLSDASDDLGLHV
jgi:hypothetical protein